MPLKPGEKIHVMTRRNFEGDLRRHFVGEVMELQGALARLEGYAFVLNTGINQYERRPEKRTRLVGIGDIGNIVHILPAETDLEQVRYAQSPEKRLVITDGKTFSLDVNEFGSRQ